MTRLLLRKVRSVSGIGDSATDGTETDEDTNEWAKDGPTAVIEAGFPSNQVSGMSTKLTYKEVLMNKDEKENMIGNSSVGGEKGKILTSQTLSE